MASLTVNPDYKLIGNNIKQMRTKSQVSQQSLAKAINISQTHMSNRFYNKCWGIDLD